MGSSWIDPPNEPQAQQHKDDSRRVGMGRFRTERYPVALLEGFTDVDDVRESPGGLSVFEMHVR